MAKKDNNKEKKSKNFGKELKSELKKVSWPTFKQLVNNTSAVISIVLIISAIVFVLDVCFESLNDFGIGKLKGMVSSNREEIENVDDANIEGENIDNTEIQQEVTEEDTTESTDNESGEDANTEVNSEAEVVQ